MPENDSAEMQIASQRKKDTGSEQLDIDLAERQLQLSSKRLQLEEEGVGITKRQLQLDNRRLELDQTNTDVAQKQLEISTKGLHLDETSVAITERRLEAHKKLIELEERKHEFERYRYDEDLKARNAEREAVAVSRYWAQRSERLKTVIMPTLIVLLSATLGTGLGLYLQNRSFRNNELFKARLEQIVRQRTEAVSLLQDVDDAWRQVRSDEDLAARQIEDAKIRGQGEVDRVTAYYCSQGDKSNGLETLRKARSRSNALADQTKTFGENNPTAKAFKQFEVRLQSILECAENRDCRRCAVHDSDLLQPLKDVITSYGALESSLLAGVM